jgi:hypothetical protein
MSPSIALAVLSALVGSVLGSPVHPGGVYKPVQPMAERAAALASAEVCDTAMLSGRVNARSSTRNWCWDLDANDLPYGKTSCTDFFHINENGEEYTQCGSRRFNGPSNHSCMATTHVLPCGKPADQAAAFRPLTQREVMSCGLDGLTNAKQKHNSWCWELDSNHLPGKHPSCKDFYTINPVSKQFTVCQGNSPKTGSKNHSCTMGVTFSCYVPQRDGRQSKWLVPEGEDPDTWGPWNDYKTRGLDHPEKVGDDPSWVIPPGFKEGKNGQPSDYSTGVCPDGCNPLGGFQRGVSDPKKPEGVNPLGDNPGGTAASGAGHTGRASVREQLEHLSRAWVRPDDEDDLL